MGYAWGWGQGFSFPGITGRCGPTQPEAAVPPEKVPVEVLHPSWLWSREGCILEGASPVAQP